MQSSERVDVAEIQMEESYLIKYKDAIALTASVCFILQMLAPVPTCYKFIQDQGVGDMSALPYVSAYLSCSLWLLYGFILNDIAIGYPNIIGASLQFSYCICFYIYCNCKARVRRQLMGASLILSLTLLYSYLEPNLEALIHRLGLLTCFITILFFASPFATLRHVLRVWNTESLPSLFILFTFIVSLQWWVYGVIIDNLFVQIPNIIGTVLPGIQLLLILFLPRHPTKTSAMKAGKVLPT